MYGKEDREGYEKSMSDEKFLVAAPLTGREHLVKELYLASSLRPDVLEFRTDVFDARDYPIVKKIAEWLGVKLMVSIKCPLGGDDYSEQLETFEESGYLNQAKQSEGVEQLADDVVFDNQENKKMKLTDFFDADFLDVDIERIDELKRCLMSYLERYVESVKGAGKQNQAGNVDGIEGVLPKNSFFSTLKLPKFIISHHIFEERDEFRDDFDVTLEKVHLFKTELVEFFEQREVLKDVFKASSDVASVGSNRVSDNQRVINKECAYQKQMVLIPKLAFTPKSEKGVFDFLNYVQKYAGAECFSELGAEQGGKYNYCHKIIGVTMGNAGIAGRLLLPQMGSRIAYAYLETPNALGQLPISFYKSLLSIN